ncbi:MAG: hypothetical protein LBQ93_03660 [Treponema sp.]|jgi:hypothetical protein|nr:hypothetical protein [Treponema sp.]
MLQFKITGTLNGKECSIVWSDGEISGDHDAVERAKIENLKDHGNLGMPPSTKSNYLADANAAYYLITGIVFDKVVNTEPEFRIPEDADV